MNYSPKLKKVIERIKDIIKDENIAGLVVLHEPGFAEYALELTPSYSAVTIDKNKGMLRIKTTNQGYSKKEKKKLVENSLNMLHLIGLVGGEKIMTLNALSEIIEKKVDAKHTGGNSSNNISQNN